MGVKPDRVQINGHWYVVKPGSYQELDPAQIASQQHEGQAGYADFVNMSTFAQDDFSGGYGKKRYGLNDNDGRRDRTYEVENVDTSHPGIVIPAFDVESTDVGLAVVQFIERESVLFALGGQKCLAQSDFDANTWAESADFGAGVDLLPGCAAIFSGTTTTPKLYVGIGSTGPFQYYDGSWHAHSTQKADLFAPAGGDDSAVGKDLLLLGERPNQVRDSADGATFTSPYYVGDADALLTSLYDFDDYWMAGKENGEFTIFSSGRVRALSRDVIRHSENCQAVTDWGGIMWFNLGLGLCAFSGSQLLNVGAEEGVRYEVPTCDESELVGRITCLMGGHPRWLFAVMKTLSGKHFLMKYDGDPDRGRGWHPIWTPGGTTAITALYWHQKAGERPRLMMGVGNSIAYMTFSDSLDDGIMDPACKFVPYGTVTLPAHALNLPNIDKTYIGLHVEVLHRYLVGGAVVIGEDPDDETFIDLIYSVDGATEETLARVYDTGIIHRQFSVPTTGKWLTLKLGLGTNDAAGEKFPIVRLALAEEDLILMAKREWQMTLLVGAEVDTRDRRGVEEQLTDLETARGAGPVDFTSLRGQTLTGLVVALPKKQVNTDNKEGFRNEGWAIPVVIREYGARQTIYYFDDEEARVDTAVLV